MTEFPRAAPLVQLCGLTKQYREGDRTHSVIHDLNACIDGGEFVVLLGRSGSGKTTLLNLISGIDTPSKGEVLIRDTHLTRLSERERTLFRRRHIGFVFQFFNLIPTLTVEENLLLPLELNGLDKDGRRLAQSLLDEVGLLERARAYPDRLSGGEQQRVAIARALIHKPLLLLADEPTGNLDADTGQQVLALLEHLAREAGMTVIMVTHSSDAALLADRVLSLRHGQLIETAAGLEPA
jgi:putative ABC transport system ATP-binding protein